MKPLYPIALALVLISILVACTKKVAKNPALAYSDFALLDSCLKPNRVYYKNDANTLLSGSAGPHGSFKLRFNSIASKALTDNGKLPVNGIMPNGSLVVKDIYSGGSITLYAYMYKLSGSWLWGEIKPNKEILFSVNKSSDVCTSCHRQTGNRDLVVSFNFH
jgi:hypothetical protein